MDESANSSEKKSKSDKFCDVDDEMDESANSSEKKSKSDKFCDVDDGINLNCNNSLHMACENGDLKLVEHLIQQDVKLCFVKNGFGMTPLDVAVQNGKIDVINIFLKYYCPESVKEVTATTMAELFSDNSSLHLACQNGDLKSVEQLIQQDVKLCFVKNRFGMTPLDVAVQNGKIDVINIFFKYCLESVKEVTATTMSTCLHMAVKHNKIDVLLQLLIWIGEERNDFKDVEENTTSQFSTSTKLLETIRELLSSKLEDVNDLNQDDISCNEGEVPVAGYTFSYSEKKDVGTICVLSIGPDKNLQEPEVTITWDFTTQKIEVEFTRYSLVLLATLISKMTGHSLLLLAILITTMAGFLLLTGIVPFHRDSNMQSSFILLNSKVFLALVRDTVLHLAASLQKLRPQISISALLGSYMFSLKAIMPNEALGVLFKSIPMLSNRSSGKSGLLLIATLITTITFQVPFHLLGNSSEEGYEQDSTMSYSLVLFSSTVFISSVGVIIHIMHEFPQKPWPHILILALFASYMLALKAIMPSEAGALFFCSIPILWVGICRKTSWLIKPKSS